MVRLRAYSSSGGLKMDSIQWSDIEGKLKPYYSDRHRQILDINKFIKTEMLLHLFGQLTQNEEADKAYLLLTKLHLIGNRFPGKLDYLLFNASQALKEINSKNVWEEWLAAYQRIDASIRLFDFTGTNFLLQTARTNIPYSARSQDYDRFLWAPPAAGPEEKVTFAGGDDVYVFYNQKFPEQIRFPKLPQVDPATVPAKNKKGGKINLPLTEILEGAAEMEKILREKGITNERTSWVEAVRQISLKSPRKDQLAISQTFEVDRICNIVGMVGAGKSTFMKVATYCLAKQDYRIVLVVDSVVEVLKTVRLFKKLGLAVTPLLGRYSREQQLDKVMEQEAMFIDRDFAPHLTTVCPLDGLLRGDNALDYGDEPCTSLRKKDHKSKVYICPYYTYCPSKRDEVAIVTSNIVVTTPAGFIYGRAPFPVTGAKMRFVEYVLRYFDVVFFDEADRVQGMFDAEFCPSTSLDELIANSSELAREYMEAGGRRLEMEEEERKYMEQILSLPKLCDAVKNLIENNEAIANWQMIGKGNSFSALLLVENESRLPFKARRELLNFIQGKTTSRELENILAHINDDFALSEQRIRDWVAGMEEVDQETLIRITLILYLMALEKKLRLITAYGSAVQSDKAIIRHVSGFLKNHFRELQKLLPASAVGNIFGFTYDQRSRILKIFRQYAFGRALMLSLPYLAMDQAQKPTGPHVVLLSGTSWAKGAYKYHIYAPVNYLLEANPAIRTKIEESKVVKIPMEVRVSGSGDQRTANMQELLKRCFGYIQSELDTRPEGRILFIVNSYREGYEVQEILQKDFPKEDVYSLIPDDEEEKGKTIKRGDISRFFNKDSRMLVAPAGAIERGHNIVDETGHSVLTSVFFLVRPMSVPGDLEEVIANINGRVSALVEKETGEPLFTRLKKIRQEATASWRWMLSRSHYGLDYLAGFEKRDIAVSRLVIIYQIFGRLARITDPQRPAPAIYFADGAFDAKEKQGFSLIQEMMAWLKLQIEEGEEAAIADSLYGAFYRACKRGLGYG